LKIVKKLSFIGYLIALGLGTGSAHAHPHLRLAYQIEPLLSNDTMSGFHISWQMDAQSSIQVRENIDLNQNGVLDPDELQAFADGNSSLMQPYKYFLTLEDGQTAAPLSFEVSNFSARDGGRGFQGGIYFEFDVQLTNALSHSQVHMQMQDPTWYIGFSPRMGQVLAADSECHSEFTREKRQTPSQGEQEVQRIVVQCAKGSAAQPDAHVSFFNEPVKGDKL